jgi:hypothetical protein
LANRPGGHATFDEVRREVRVIFASGNQTEQLKRFSALGDIDIFQSGLVLRDDAGLQITDAGLALLDSLENSDEPPLEFSSAPAAQRFDSLLSVEERLRTFDLEPMSPEDGDHNDQPQSAQDEEIIEPPHAALRIGAMDLPNKADSNVREPGRKSFAVASLATFIAAKKRSILEIGRSYFAQQTSLSNRRIDHPGRRAGGAAFALLSLAFVVACVIAAIAFGQIQSLKSDLAALRRELLPVRERVAKLEQAEKAKRDLDESEETQNKAGAEKNKAGGETRSDQTTALNFSREEIQLIREYIKPATGADTGAPAINVGDSVSGAMIPLPSQLTDKVPKLLGSRFTTRNGAIIIVKRGSRQADAVLMPN